MIHKLPNDVLYKIIYNNKDIDSEKKVLKNLLLTNNSLFNFIILKYEKLFLNIFDKNYRKYLQKYNKIYHFGTLEDLAIIDTYKFKDSKIVSLRSCYNIYNVSPLCNVEYLDLSNCDLIKDVSMLGKCKKLELSNCYKITDVSNLGNVKYLDLSHCHNIKNISNLGNHYYLNLSGCNKITKIDNLKNITKLNLSYTDITNINCLKNVYKLDVSYCNKLEITESMNNYKFVAESTNLINNDIIYLKNIHTLILKKNYWISDLSCLETTKILDITKCTNIRFLPNKNILDELIVSKSNYYANLIHLDIDNLNIKNIYFDYF